MAIAQAIIRAQAVEGSLAIVLRAIITITGTTITPLTAIWLLRDSSRGMDWTRIRRKTSRIRDSAIVFEINLTLLDFGYGPGGYGNGLMNAYGLLRNGYSQANAYSMMKNNLLFEDKAQFDKQKLKKDKELRIKRFEFLTQKPKNWIFELPKGNPLAKKKVKDLPDKYKQYIIKVSQGLRKNKTLLEEIKTNSKNMMKEVETDMKELIHDNVLSLKFINIKLMKFTNGLKEVTELMKYFEITVGQLKRYFDLLKSDHMKVYTIPSDNAIAITTLLKERFKNCTMVMTELTNILAKDKNSTIPDNTIR